MTLGAQGSGVKVCLIASLPFSSSAKPLAINRESMTAKDTRKNHQATYGSRSQHAEHTRITRIDVAGQLEFPWTPEFGAYILPFIMGANASGTTFALGETLTPFQLQIDRVSKVFTYNDCYVNKATWKAATGDFVMCTLDLLAVSETVGNSGTGQSLTTPLELPYIFSDGALTMDSVSRAPFDFELTVDNKLTASFRNATTAGYIAPSDLREVAFKTTNPYGSTETDLYNQALAGIAVSLVLTNGNYSTTFAMPAVQFPSESPTRPDNSEMKLMLDGIARMTSTSRELVITHDSTP